ncbi:MAG: hypothetical protein ACREQV_00290 [Candidatus Binatia bacterium]
MRIDRGKSVSTPLAQGQEVAPVSYRRVPQKLVSQHGAKGALPPLELGQELEALVVEERVGGRLLLKVGDTLIEADSPGGLGAGQHIRLRVEQLQPQVVLHVTDVESSLEMEATRLLRSHLPAYADSGELLDDLQDKLAGFLDPGREITPGTEKLAKLRDSISTLLASAMPPTPEGVKILARDGGLFYEAKIFEAANNDEQFLDVVDHDLKGLLLSALQGSKAQGFSTGLQNALNAQLENLERQQAVNLLAQLDGGAVQLQIPFFDGGRFSTAALSVEPDGHRSEGKPDTGKRGYSLLFMLDLESFGRTRIEAHVGVKEVRAVFFAEDVRSLQWIRQELPGFRETLMALGYEDVMLAAKLLRDLPRDRQEKFAALAAGVPSSIHLLDLKA